ncbi:MAG: metallophosphoesterase [Pirellulaceae bacterium]
MMGLVQPMFDGPVDVIGDIHGDWDALQRLLSHLGYDSRGEHPESRRMVFVGDFVDRGPKNVDVVRFVRGLIQDGRAQSVLGNHELNLLLDKRKTDNEWFFANETDEEIREELLEFFRTLPLVLFRDDARVVHACWQPEMVDMASESQDVVALFQQHRFTIDIGLAKRSDLKPWQKEMRHQNLNPVKVLTSGLEVQSTSPFMMSGKKKTLERFPWWMEYDDEPFCFFGHYSLPSDRPRGSTHAICVDFGLSKRWVGTAKEFPQELYRLGAYRLPEHLTFFDNGEKWSRDGEDEIR